MSTSSLPPTSRDEAPIDAEFEPAKPAPGSKPKSKSGPGWGAFLLLALLAAGGLGLGAAGAGLVPGFKPGAADLGAIQTDLTALKAAQSDTAANDATRASDLTALKSTTDSLRADRTRARSDIRSLKGEIETLQADISILQRARIAGLAEANEASHEDQTAITDLPDLSALETRLTALEDALVSQLSTYETSLESLRVRLADLEAKAETESLLTATSTNARTEAALALSAIEAAARRGRPFLSAQQKLTAAMPGNQAIERLAPLAAKAVPTLSDLQTDLPPLVDRALDRDAIAAGAGNSWVRGIFGDGVQIKRTGEVSTRDHLERASAALQANDLSDAIQHIRALDANIQPVFTDWLNNAEDRHTLEETLDALRLTMIAEERP
jgi:hypothetical protein